MTDYAVISVSDKRQQNSTKRTEVRVPDAIQSVNVDVLEVKKLGLHKVLSWQNRVSITS